MNFDKLRFFISLASISQNDVRSLLLALQMKPFKVLSSTNKSMDINVLG